MCVCVCVCVCMCVHVLRGRGDRSRMNTENATTSNNTYSRCQLVSYTVCGE